MRQRGIVGTNCPAVVRRRHRHPHDRAACLPSPAACSRPTAMSGRDSGRFKAGCRADVGMAYLARRQGRSASSAYGHIGRQVAQRAVAFGMVVRHHDPTVAIRYAEGWLPFDELLAVSDVVSLHCPLNETHTPSDRRGRARPHKARRDPAQRVARSGRQDRRPRRSIAAARPTPRRRAWMCSSLSLTCLRSCLTLPDVVLSPHMGGCTVEARLSACRLCVENVIAVLERAAADYSGVQALAGGAGH